MAGRRRWSHCLSVPSVNAANDARSASALRPDNSNDLWPTAVARTFAIKALLRIGFTIGGGAMLLCSMILAAGIGVFCRGHDAPATASSNMPPAKICYEHQPRTPKKGVTLRILPL